jgi:hypothetical protein
MTDKKKTEKVVYENPDGEIFDVDGAFKRHLSIAPGKANIDLWVKAERSNGLYFELRLSAGTMARLVQILNAAPVDGNPLQAIVSLDLDTTANEAEREALVDYLSGNGYDATLENVAAGYIYDLSSDKPLLLDVVTSERREYAVTRVWSKSDSPSHVYPGGNRKPAYLNLKTPEETVTITSEKDVINIEDLEGVIIGNGKWCIMHALEPGGKAPLGGFILERIKEGDD